jgi:hypothetical protein
MVVVTGQLWKKLLRPHPMGVVAYVCYPSDDRKYKTEGS